uniref:Uncharacterized protein n=1 Tax=Rhizophora mucronata TaxID=61149 RepID=A0A2P2L7V4_RHIMU
MLPKIEEAKHIRASMALQAQNPTVGPKLNQDYGDTVPSRKIQVESEESSSSVGMQLVAEGDFGTVIVHGGEETDLTALQSKPCDARQCSQDLVHVEGSSVSGTAGKSARSRVDGSRGVPADDTLVGESDSLVQTLPAPLPSDISTPEQNLKKNNSSQVPVEGSGGILGSTLKNENVKKAFALQDKLWSIYAAGNTVPIPFLRATDISPIALLSDNVLGGMKQDAHGSVAVEELQELFTGDGISKKGRRVQNEMPLPASVYQRLTSSSTLMNLAQALAYHKTCHEEMPLQELQATQEQQTIQNLTDTLRTILRL